MKTFLSDKNPEVEEKWFEMQSRLSPAEKLSKALDLNDFVRNLSRRAIKRANPHADRRTLDLLFVEYHYGKELADKLKKYLEELDKKSNSSDADHSFNK